MLHELPLVLFTVAAQMSVGSFLVLGLINVLGSRKSAEVLRKVTNPALYAIGPLLIFGFAASTMHLGTPLRAPNSLLHLFGSWLSREIFVGSAFVGLGAVFAICTWFNWLGIRLRQLLAALTALVGVVLIFVIGQVYSLRTVPAWATWFTTGRFFVTTLLLGALAVATALVVTSWFRRKSMDEETSAFMATSIRWLSLAAVAALGVKFVLEPLYLGFLATNPQPAAQASLQLITGTYGGFLALEYGLVLLALIAMGFVLFGLGQTNLGQFRLSVWIVVAFLLALGAELIGRMLFYASMVRIGM